MNMKAKICGRETNGMDVYEALVDLTREEIHETLASCVRWQVCRLNKGTMKDVKRVIPLVECVAEAYIEATVNQMMSFYGDDDGWSFRWGTIEISRSEYI